MTRRKSQTILHGGWCLVTLALFGVTATAAPPPAATPMAPGPKAISELLAIDTAPGRNSVDPAKAKYQQALSLAPRDARLEYAYSLVLTRLFQAGEAREHFNRALEIEPGFVPARQAAIRDLIKSQKFQEAAEQIAAFGGSIVPSDRDAAETVRWLGRMVSCVIGAVGTPDAQVSFTYQDRALRASLSPVLLAAYERGFADVEQELETFKQSIEEARSMAEGRREVAKAKVDAGLADDQTEIKLKLQDADKARKKWDEWITDQTAKADDLLVEQEKRFQDLDRAATTQQTAIVAIRMQLDRIDRGLTPTNRSQTVNSNTRDLIERSLAVEELKLQTLFGNQSDLARKAAETVAARRNAVAQYQKATGVVMKEVATLDRWEKRNKAVAVSQKKSADKKPAMVASLEAKIKSINTWDPVDFESEKRRLLSDLGVAAP